MWEDLFAMDAASGECAGRTKLYDVGEIGDCGRGESILEGEPYASV